MYSDILVIQKKYKELLISTDCVLFMMQPMLLVYLVLCSPSHDYVLTLSLPCSMPRLIGALCRHDDKNKIGRSKSQVATLFVPRRLSELHITI